MARVLPLVATLATLTTAGLALGQATPPAPGGALGQTPPPVPGGALGQTAPPVPGGAPVGAEPPTMAGPATPGDGLPEDYKQAFRRGANEMYRGKFPEARASFHEAHRIFPNARTLRSLGKAEFELDNYIESIEYLEQSLASTARPLTAEMREDVTKLLAIARGLVTTLWLVTKPGDATVTLDGTAVTLDDRGRIPLVVGKHELTVRAPGYMTSRRKLDVESGPETRVEVTLMPTIPARAESSALYERWWFWVAAGVAVAGAIVAGVALASGGKTYEPNTEVMGAVQVMALEAR